MRQAGETDGGARRSGLLTAGGIVALAGLILLLHGGSLSHGLFMDDYAHFQQLRECGWSLGELTRACRLELVGEIIELWWMPELTLRFFRPVAFGLMKLTYTLSDWDPSVMHAASLGWHLAVCTLLMFLLRRVGLGRGISWCLAALFAVHPAHIATVRWIACQSELMVTAFLLASFLCYARFRALPGDGAGEPRDAGSGAAGWAVASAAFFGLAVGCRENAIVFPFVLLAVELVLRGSRPRGVLVLFGVFGLMIAGYLALRWQMLGGAALPPRPYIVPPSAPDFPRYVFDKACYYLLAEYLAAPCVPIGGLAYLRDHPLMFYGLAAFLVAVMLPVCLRRKRRLAAMLGGAWLGGFLLPVLPAFESPHHLYLPGIGWAITAALLFAGRGEADPTSAGRRGRIARWGGLGLAAVVFAGATHFFGLALDTAQRVEDLVAEEVSAAPSGLHDGDRIYIFNLPIIAHYLKLAVEQRTGLRDLRVSALTWA
ncbi:hypothetical protein LCGC14_1447810, partial [marine sediment metagenome]